MTGNYSGNPTTALQLTESIFVVSFGVSFVERPVLIRGNLQGHSSVEIPRNFVASFVVNLVVVFFLSFDQAYVEVWMVAIEGWIHRPKKLKSRHKASPTGPHGWPSRFGIPQYRHACRRGFMPRSFGARRRYSPLFAAGKQLDSVEGFVLLFESLQIPVRKAG